MNMDNGRLIGSKNMILVRILLVILISSIILALSPAGAATTTTTTTTTTTDDSAINDGDYEVVDGYDGYTSVKDADEQAENKFKDDLFLGSLLITLMATLLCLYFYTRKGQPLPTEIRVKPRNDFYFNHVNHTNPPTNPAPDYGTYEQQYQDMYGSLEQKY